MTLLDLDFDCLVLSPRFNYNDITHKQLRISSTCWSVDGVSVIPPKSLQTDRITCLNQQDTVFLSFSFSVFDVCGNCWGLLFKILANRSLTSVYHG